MEINENDHPFDKDKEFLAGYIALLKLDSMSIESLTNEELVDYLALIKKTTTRLLFDIAKDTINRLDFMRPPDEWELYVPQTEKILKVLPLIKPLHVGRLTSC